MEIELRSRKPIGWSWRRSCRDLLTPAVCFACEIPISNHRKVLLCQSCYRLLQPPTLGKSCSGCAARFPGETVELTACLLCKSWKNPFDSVTAVANYAGPIKDWVIRMKQRNGQITALQLGSLLTLNLECRLKPSSLDDIDWITPMPSHWQRRLRRGFNVPDLLVEPILRSQKIGGKFKKLLVVQRKTKKQGTLSRSQRFENVKDCFRIYGKPSLKGATILLVDDVMTSGATALQAASTLRKAGAAAIHLAIIARGIGYRI